MDKAVLFYKFIKDRPQLFAGAHSVYTPQTLVDSILNKIEISGSILVLFNIEFVISLVHTYRVNPAQITLYSDHEHKTNIGNSLGCHVITEIEEDMKFDVVVMNPPYTNGQVMLYAKFFDQALKLGTTVACVMPLDLQTRHDKLKFHNNRVRKHSYYISENVSDHFKVAYDNLHYVIASRSVNNPVEHIADPLDYIPLLYPERPRLQPIKGDTDTAIGAEVPNGVDTIFKVHKNDTVLYKKVDPKKVSKSSKKSSAPYLVIVNHTPSLGKFNCAIIPNNGLTWSMWTFAFECQSQEEATKLKNWIKSDEIVAEVKKMLTARNNQHTISKAMIERLPTYGD